MRTQYFFYIFSFLFLFSCDDDSPEDLPSVEERVSTAVGNLRNDLTAPANGWVLDYQPNENSGFYKVLMKFEPDGKLNIQTDSPVNDGEFYNQNTTYRIDAARSLEVIIETYGFFHFLFEQNQTTFGGEFEFSYNQKDGDNLIFTSISDFSNPTVLVFEPATTTDETSVQNSQQLAELLQESLEGPGSQVFPAVRFQLAIPSVNTTIYFVFNFNTRTLKSIAASQGLTETEVLANDNTISLNQNSGYGFIDGNILLEEPLTFALNGTQVVISRIALSDIAESSISYCEGIDERQFAYSSNVLGTGEATATTGIFASATAFRPLSNGVYSVNTNGLIDENGESRSEEILAIFPEAVGFQFYYEFDLGDELFNALGFILVDENNSAEFLLRRYEIVEEGNRFNINLLDDFLETREMTPEEEADFITLTDQVFEGSEVYALDYADDDDLFVLYNPCNRNEVILFN